MENIVYTLSPYNIIVTVNDGCGEIQSTLHKDGIFTRREADIIESVILAHACAGVDVGSKEYIEGLKTLEATLAND